jgi:hypothetical protein
VSRDGDVVLETVSRGKSATRRIERVRGKKVIASVATAAQ